MRRTKIIATLGPATDSRQTIDRMILAGMNVARLNLSHGTAKDHKKRAKMVRARAKALNRWVGILADLQGPKIRIERFKTGKIMLHEGGKFCLDADCAPDAGTSKKVGITYKKLPHDVHAGDTLLLDDGRIVLKVDKVSENKIHCLVDVGGELSDSKGINRQGGGLSTAALTEKDKKDIKLAVELEADFLAVSFPRNAFDIRKARDLLRRAGGKGHIVAKIERAEALDCIEEIIAASDIIMIARGDLGVEIGDAALPPIQKKIITLSRSMNRIVITATQMMESMIENQIPTRAEVFDVANAVLDGTDAVMLSAETAAGNYPDKVIAAMARICREAEKQEQATTSGHRINSRFTQIDEAISMAAIYAANHLDIKAIAALTESGSTPLWMSRLSSAIPIYALTKHKAIRRRVTIYRDVYPASFNIDSQDHALVNKEAVDELVRRGAVNEGDLVLISKGDLTGVTGGTNSLKIVRVGAMAEPLQI